MINLDLILLSKLTIQLVPYHLSLNKHFPSLISKEEVILSIDFFEAQIFQIYYFVSHNFFRKTFLRNMNED